MIVNRPWWRRPIVILLLIALAAGAGAWLALDRPLPEALTEPERRPAWLSPPGQQDDRLYCAESPETGVCRCITADGRRPEIDEETCRRLAREGS